MMGATSLLKVGTSRAAPDCAGVAEIVAIQRAADNEAVTVIQTVARIEGGYNTRVRELSSTACPGEVGARLFEAGTQSEGFFEFDRCHRGAAVHRVGDTEVIVQLGAVDVLTSAFERTLIVRNGICRSSGLDKEIAGVDVRRHVVGIDLQRAFKMRERLGGPAVAHQKI